MVSTSVGRKRLKGREERKVETALSTIDEIVEGLGDRIGKGAEEFRGMLGRDRGVQLDSEYLGSLACFIECLMFEWFITDVMVASEFEAHGEAIRSKLGTYLFRGLELSSSTNLGWGKFERHHMARFSEYLHAWGSEEGGRGLQRLAALAWCRISESEEPNVGAWYPLAVWFTARAKSLEGSGAKVKLVG